ncbi:MAG: ATP-binding protein [Verrucomicrobiota bacterium]
MAFDLLRNRISPILLAIVAWTGVFRAVSAEPSDASVVVAPRLSLVHLRETVSEKERSILTFRLEGVVCAASSRRGWVVLDDGTSTDLLEIPSLPQNLRPGDSVVIHADNCLVSRGAHAIELGIAPVVAIDGQHSPLSTTGKVFLREGMRGLRVEWFNGHAGATLKLEYERKGMTRQVVPPGFLWHRAAGQTEFKPGLEYASYIDSNFRRLPDFSLMEPEARGVVPDFDLSVRSRPEMAALVFSGFLQVPETGLYQFHLTSDDGARVFLVDAPVTCDIVQDDRGRSVTTQSLATSVHAGTVNQWVVFEGTVNYAAKVGSRIELEVTGNSQSFHVTVVDGSGLHPASLLHERVRIAGLRRNSGIVAIDETQFQDLSDGPDKEKVMTQVVEIRQLQRDEADKPYRAEIQGVVTMVAPKSLVLQDATGGVFVHYLSTTPGNIPHPGELWRISGRTGPGDFSPVIHVDRATCIGNAPLPTAVPPTQQQLASGSLDAEMVEIEGVVIEISDSEIKLLTRGGKASIINDSLYPLPTIDMPSKERASLVGSVVRLRGVYRAIWDSTTGNVQSAVLMLGNASMSVDEPASGDPFAATLIRPSELLLFTSHPTALRRVRVKGQLLYARPPELFLFDGTSGVRASTRDAPDLFSGDEVEVSGFPQLGGPSPALLEARARRAGKSPLPSPTRVAATNLPDARLDSTLVEVEGTLLSDTVRMDERALEMRAGSNRFVAFVPSGTTVPEEIERDSVLKLTGVYISATADRTLSSSDPFEMRLLSAGDIKVVKRGPWWTTRHTFTVIGILSAGLVLAASWVTLLRRTVARRSSELALEIEEREMIERHRAMEQERSRMAKDLHDELGSGLTEAGILSSLMRNPAIPKEKKDGYLDQLNGLCCTLVTGLDEIVWAVNPRYDSVADLAGYFSLFAQRFLTLAGIDCRLKIDDAITTDPLDSRMRHEIFLAFKEALNNIVRHSGAKVVHLTIEVAAGSLIIFVADDGCGFDRSVILPGSDGLRNMEERIRSVRGTCLIETTPGGGTSIQFKISLKGKPI